jgi:hypothetical protein
MNVEVSPLEFTWVALNLLTLAFTITAFFDARADREAVRLLNGKARELAATGILRREGIRVIVQLMLLAVAVPGLFLADREPRPPEIAVFTISCLMAVPVLLLVSSFWDARDRKRMTVLVTAEPLVTKTTSLDRIEAALERNTTISQQASDHADRAYHEANSVNEKIASQGAALVRQGDAMDADRARTAAAIDTIDTTAEQVSDLHEGTAPEQRP